MRLYLGLAVLFLVLLWDVGKNNGQLIHGATALVLSLLRAAGFA